MKKILFTLLIALTVLFSGCDFHNLALPETVSVKTQAKYDFTIAQLDSNKQEWLNLSKKLDLSAMMGGDGESQEQSMGGFKLYKYNDGSPYQQFLMHMPLADIDFDFSEAFKNMDFSTAVEGFDIDKDITIPSIGNLHQSQELELDQIKQTLNAAVTFEGYTAASADVGFTGLTFDSIQYKTGTLTVVTDENYSGSVSIWHGDSQINNSASFNGGRTATLSLNNASIYSSDMKLKFSGPNDVHYTAVIAPESDIKKVINVTYNDPLHPLVVPEVNVSFPVNIGDDVEACSITDGSMSVVIATPEGWSSTVIANYEINVSGALSSTPAITITKANPTENFTNSRPAVLAKGNINARSNVTIALTGATIDFTKKPVVDATIAITTMSATVKLPDSFKTSVTVNKEVGDLATYVQNITWKQSGFRIKAKNTLPEGNDVRLSIDCDFFKIETDPLNIPKIIAGGPSATEQTLSYMSPADTTFTTKFVNDGAVEGDYYSSIALTGNIGLPGGASDRVSVTNVSPGATYKLSIKVEPVLEWERAKVKLPDSASSFNGEFESKINKQDLLKNFGESFAADYADKIQFTTLPLYLYANFPDMDLFDNAAYKGTVSVFYGKKPDENSPIEKTTNSDEIYLLGKETSPGSGVYTEEVITLTPMPEIIKNAAGEVITRFSNPTFDFNEALSMPEPTTPVDVEGDSLCLSYNIALEAPGGATDITKAEVEEMKAAGKTSISVDVAIILTMQFQVTQTISMDIMELINGKDDGSTPKTDQEKDLFNRTERTDMSSFEQYIDVIKSAKLQFINPKFPLKSSGGIKLNIKWDDSSPVRTFEIKDGTDTSLEVNPKELLNIYPLEPKINLSIGKGNFGLPKDMSIQTLLRVSIQTDGEIPVYPFNAGGAD